MFILIELKSVPTSKNEAEPEVTNSDNETSTHTPTAEGIVARTILSSNRYLTKNHFGVDSAPSYLKSSPTSNSPVISFSLTAHLSASLKLRQQRASMKALVLKRREQREESLKLQRSYGTDERESVSSDASLFRSEKAQKGQRPNLSKLSKRMTLGRKRSTYVLQRKHRYPLRSREKPKRK